MRLVSVALTASLVLVSAVASLAQSARSPQSSPSMSVPRLINVSGVVQPAPGQPAARVEMVTLAIYAEETGGVPLWEETQSVTVDPSGRYSLLLGATQADGVPLDVFASGEARWLGMAWMRPGEVEGPRGRITSVPYALRASDAETLGGRPASAYVLAPAAGGATTSTGTDTAGGGVVPNQDVLPGTTNFLAKYVDGANVGNSAVYEHSGLVGINTTAPLDVLHARFYNSTGAFTGFAVQNLASSATSYSGMLFYDHNGALGQFQGFNNSTKEYRINNIAPGGSINFMLGGTSRLKVANNGFIEVSATDAATRLMVGPIVGGSSFSGNLGVTGDGNGAQGVAVFDRLNDDGTLVRFRRDGSTQGTIDVAAGTVTYNAFTGSHYARTDETIERGMLVSLTGRNGRLEDRTDSEILYGVAKSRRANDPAILGAYLARQSQAAAHLRDSANPHLVMAVGNGEMWVIDTGRDLVAGDYLVSSAVPGHAMTDPGTFETSYIVARVAEPITWKDVATRVPGADGREHKRALVSVFFENFVISRPRHSLTDDELVRLRQEIASLTEQLTALQARDKAREARLAQLENGRNHNAARTPPQ